MDDKTVKCFLSNEELEEYEIDYKDFILRNGKARQVVHDIIVQAAEQVGYRPPKFAFDMQIMMLPDQGLLLTFSESDVTELSQRDVLAMGDARLSPKNDGSEMWQLRQVLEYLKEVKKALAATREELEIRAGTGAAVEKGTAKGGRSESGQNTEQAQTAIFVFEGIRQVMEYAEVLPGNLRVQSALYEMDEKYYLFLGRGGASHERYSLVCIRAMEFGYLYSADERQWSLLQEHGKCLIGEKALQKLHG